MYWVHHRHILMLGMGALSSLWPWHDWWDKRKRKNFNEMTGVCECVCGAGVNSVLWVLFCGFGSGCMQGIRYKVETS